MAHHFTGVFKKTCEIGAHLQEAGSLEASGSTCDTLCHSHHRTTAGPTWKAHSRYLKLHGKKQTTCLRTSIYTKNHSSHAYINCDNGFPSSRQGNVLPLGSWMWVRERKTCQFSRFKAHSKWALAHVEPRQYKAPLDDTYIVLRGATEAAWLALDALPLVGPHCLHHVLCELQACRVTCGGPARWDMRRIQREGREEGCSF